MKKHIPLLFNVCIVISLLQIVCIMPCMAKKPWTMKPLTNVDAVQVRFKESSPYSGFDNLNQPDTTPYWLLVPKDGTNTFTAYTKRVAGSTAGVELQADDTNGHFEPIGNKTWDGNNEQVFTIRGSSAASSDDARVHAYYLDHSGPGGTNPEVNNLKIYTKTKQDYNVSIFFVGSTNGANNTTRINMDDPALLALDFGRHYIGVSPGCAQYIVNADAIAASITQSLNMTYNKQANIYFACDQLGILNYDGNLLPSLDAEISNLVAVPGQSTTTNRVIIYLVNKTSVNNRDCAGWFDPPTNCIAISDSEYIGGIHRSSFAHEVGHYLGLPDIYKASVDGSGWTGMTLRDDPINLMYHDRKTSTYSLRKQDVDVINP
ncbi:MAG: hypothetical protein WCJ56_07315 [bacterium]